MRTAARRILITGAAHGVGAETARIFAERGANLALVDIDAERLAQTPAAQESSTLCLQADVSDGEQMGAAVASAVDRLGGLDVVIANAGIIKAEPLAEITHKAFKQTLDVNLFGVWRTVSECLPAITASSGYVLVISSLAAAVHLPYMSTYDASKAGVEAFANAARSELRIAGSDVELGVAYFSVIDTDLARGAARSSVQLSLSDLSHGPIVKVLSPDRVARAIVRGVERRSRRIVVPWYYRPVLVAPGTARRLAEAYFRRLREPSMADGREQNPDQRIGKREVS